MEFKNKHSLGQNFLDNSLIINNIVNSVNVSKGDIVIEIGPGLGYLTTELKKYNVVLLAFEIDERTKPYLNKLVDDKMLRKNKLGTGNYYINEELFNLLTTR